MLDYISYTFHNPRLPYLMILEHILFLLYQRFRLFIFNFLFHSTTMYLWLISFTASKELSFLLLKLHYEFPDQKLSDLIGNQSLDSYVRLHHEFPDLIFLKAYGKLDTVKVSRSMGSTRYDSAKDIKTVFLGTVFLCAVNIL